MRPKSIPEEQNYRRVVEVRRGRAAYMGLGAEGRGGGAGLAVITGRSRRGGAERPSTHTLRNVRKACAPSSTTAILYRPGSVLGNKHDNGETSHFAFRIHAFARGVERVRGRCYEWLLLAPIKRERDPHFLTVFNYF